MGGLARPPLSPLGLQKRLTYRTKANKKLQKDIYYFIVVILLLMNNFIFNIFNIVLF
jgi:hypothetical protein